MGDNIKNKKNHKTKKKKKQKKNKKNKRTTNHQNIKYAVKRRPLSQACLNCLLSSTTNLKLHTELSMLGNDCCPVITAVIILLRV